MTPFLSGALGALTVLFLAARARPPRRLAPLRAAARPFGPRRLLRRIGATPEQERAVLAETDALAEVFSALRRDARALRDDLAEPRLRARPTLDAGRGVDLRARLDARALARARPAACRARARRRRDRAASHRAPLGARPAARPGARATLDRAERAATAGCGPTAAARTRRRLPGAGPGAAAGAREDVSGKAPRRTRRAGAGPPPRAGRGRSRSAGPRPTQVRIASYGDASAPERRVVDAARDVLAVRPGRERAEEPLRPGRELPP